MMDSWHSPSPSDRRVAALYSSAGCLAAARQQLRRAQVRTAPHVLSFEAELVLDGRSLPRPVNYGLVRIVPTKGCFKMNSVLATGYRPDREEGW
jgi:hypothetical protein